MGGPAPAATASAPWMWLAHGEVPGHSSPWVWEAHPEVWALVALLLVGYFYALRRWGPEHAPVGRPRATGRQKLWWVLGVAAVWVASDWPLDTLADQYLFAAHMVQHMIYAFVAAPLLLMGLPAWLVRIPLRRPGIRRVARVITRPWFGLAYFNFMIVFIHWPPVVDLQITSEPFHLFIHALILTAGLVMWWPVIDPVPELSRLSDPAKMLYLFLQSVVPTIPASFLTFGHHPLYSVYEHFPRFFGISVIDDQMMSGLIMKLGGGLLLWGVITFIFFRWYQREEEQEHRIDWDDFERELEAWDMRK